MNATLDNSDQRRKAAILLRSLDAESAAVLLAQLSPAEARALRAAVRELGEVSDEERVGVATAVRSQAGAGEASSAGVELELSAPGETAVELPAPPAEEPTPNPAVAALPTTPVTTLPDLDQANPAAIAAYLDRENASVVAVVLSSLPAEQAARVLDELRFDQRAEAIERLAELGEGDPETLQVLAADLGAWVSRRQHEESRRADRLASIGAILDAAAPTCREAIVDRLRERGCQWAGELPTRPAAIELPPEPAAVEDPPVVASVPEPEPVAVAFEPPRPPSVPFASLETVSPQLLAEVIKRTPPRQALLALAGATEALQRRIESLVPKRHARELRRRVESLGPTPLREIEAAQQAMSEIASQLWDRAVGHVHQLTN